MRNSIFLVLLLIGFGAAAQQKSKGHSHNDYNQSSPFYTAYAAGMASIEADVYFKGGKLLVAHNEEDTDPARSLEKLYLMPIAKAFKDNKGYIYSDKIKTLQLLIDVKTNHKEVLAELLAELKPYLKFFDPGINKRAVKILISGDVPSPANFKDYPDYIFFDGRNTNVYSPEQLKRLGMVSESISTFSSWNGKTPLPAEEKLKLMEAVKKSHSWNKPFRFWGTADDKRTWQELEGLGVDWIGTDHPEQLRLFLNAN
ncbi:phosphatidylinositol-specific phospholipase C/glycerophosphodiester phosphodiesterase family protein [Pedobacter sp. PWIIR3]